MGMRGFCMKRYLSLLLLAVSVIFGTGCASMKSSVPVPIKQELRMKLSNQELISLERESTVALMIYRDDKETTQTTGYTPFCTGVWVDETHILTADHCAKAVQRHEQKRLDERKQKNSEAPKSLQELLARLFGGQVDEPDTVEEKGLTVHYIVESEVMEVNKEPSAWHMSKVVGFDEAHDLALLEAKGRAIPQHKVAKLASVTPDIGEHVNVVGHPTGLYWTFISGQVSAYRGADMLKGEDNKGPWMQVMAPVFFGNSGGGCYNDFGELVGIADWIKNGPEQSFFVHLDTLRSFLQSQKVLK